MRRQDDIVEGNSRVLLVRRDYFSEFILFLLLPITIYLLPVPSGA